MASSYHKFHLSVFILKVFAQQGSIMENKIPSYLQMSRETDIVCRGEELIQREAAT